MIYTFITQLSIENGDQMLLLNIFSRKLGEKKGHHKVPPKLPPKAAGCMAPPLTEIRSVK